MSKAWELYNDSYIKGMKRPEFWGFKPDQASGASMLFRSEETNPWANRDQSNAKYGPHGGATSAIKSNQPSGISAASLGGGTGIGGMMPSSWNIPGIPSQSQNTFANNMAPLVGAAGKYAGGTIADWFKGPQSFDKLSPEMQGFADKFTTGGATDTYSKLGEQFGGEGLGATESGLGGYDKLLGSALKDSSVAMSDEASSSLLGGLSGADMGSGAAAVVPILSKMFGLKGTAGNAVGAAAGVGGAAAQGFVNPISDVAAVMSLVKLFGGLF
jgi:hypothetical protein